MTVSVTVAGAAVQVLQGSLAINDTLDQRSTCTFAVYDAAGTSTYVYGSQVVVSDSVLGTLFAGYLFDATKTAMPPNSAVVSVIQCMDQHYLADKRVYSARKEKVGLYSGDIATSLLGDYLNAEGVTAKYAHRNDTSQSDFAAGTLTNTVATSNFNNGTLELSPAGTTVTKTEASTADFNTNFSISNLDTSNNTLKLASVSALQMTGSCGNNFGNAFIYQTIWSGSYAIVSGDTLTYSVWINSSSPQVMAGADGVCTDGSTIRDFSSGNLADQNGLKAHPNADLSGFANDQWYSRQIDLTAMAGKTLSFSTIAFEGDSGGAAYFRDILIKNGVTTKLVIYQGTGPSASIVQPNKNSLVRSNGYSQVVIKPIIAYESAGTRTANPTTIAAAGIYRTSLISWTATQAVDASGATVGVLAAATSIDGGATFQGVANFGTLANLLPGASLTSKNAQTQIILINLGKDPLYTPTLTNITWTVQPAYVATKSDTSTTYDTQAQFNTGTKTNVTAEAAGDIVITSYQKNWDDASIANQTLFGAASPKMDTFKRQAALTTGANADVKVRLDGAGNWQDFTASVDIQITSASIWSGMVYRTTSWVNGRDTFAYKVDVNLSGIYLGKATNGGASSSSTLASAALSLTAGDWHTLTVVVAGNVHTAYLDGVQYFSFTDSSSPYTATGGVGLILNNSTAGTVTSYFDNFGVMVTPGIIGNSPAPQWLSPSIALGSITVGNSMVYWDASTPGGSTVVVSASVNGGAFNTCTNGAVVPGLTAGTVLVTGTVQYKVQLQSPVASLTPQVNGLTSWVLSAYNSTGTRVSPVVSLNPVGLVGNSLIGWTSFLPTGTTLGVDASPDGTTWTDVTSSNGGSIPGYTMQPDPWLDTFGPTDNSAQYTASFMNAGAAGTWALNTTTMQLTGSGGTDATYLYNPLSFKDGYVEVDLNYADVAGIGLRWQDASNSYSIKVRDDTSSAPQQTIQLFKNVAGTKTQIGSNAAITFKRGTYHRLHLECTGTTIKVLFDGAQVISITDSSVVGPGKSFLYENVKIQAFNFRVQQYGDDLTGKNVYTRLRLGSTDPTVTPYVADLFTSAHASNIGKGVLVPITNYSLYNGQSKSVSQCFDDLAQKSNYWWNIKNKILNFQPRVAVPAPYPVATANGDYLVSGLQSSNSSPQYINKEYVQGGIDTVNRIDILKGDGLTQAWSLSNPVSTLTTIAVNGVQKSFGVLSVDTGKDFYYTIGSSVISQDPNAIPVTPGFSINVNYKAQIAVVEMYQDATEQTNYAAIEGGSGIVESIVSLTSLNKAAADLQAQSDVTKYKARGRTFVYETLRSGITTGQLVAAWCPEFGLTNAQMLVSKLDTTYYYNAQVGDYQPRYKAELVEGPIIGDWTKLLAYGAKPKGK